VTRRTARRTTLLIGFAAAAVALAGLSPVSPFAHAESVCAPGSSSASFTDERNDATRVIEDTIVYSDPALDIVAASVVWNDAAQEVTFQIEVEDLQELPPVGANGEYFDFNFSSSRQGAFYISAWWSRAEMEQGFVLGRLETTRTTLATGLEGSFDVDNDLITVTLPAETRNANGDVVFSLREGEVLGGFDVVSRREILVFVPDADNAQGGDCSVTIAGLAPGSGEGTIPELDTIGQSVAFDGTIDAGAFGVCGAACPTQPFTITTPTGGATLTIALTSVTPDDGTTDLDLRLRGPNSLHLLTEDPGNGDTITLELPADGSLDGTYTLEIVPYSAVQASFFADLALS
jgi:hypothetical protein